MKKSLFAIFIIFSMVIFAETTFKIDIKNGNYQGLVFNCKFENSVIFQLDNDTSNYSIKISLYSLKGKYMFTIFDGNRPADFKVRWNALTPDYKHLKAGVYLLYFEKKDSTGKTVLKFFLPLLAAFELER